MIHLMMFLGVCARDWWHTGTKAAATCKQQLERSTLTRDGLRKAGNAPKPGSRNGDRSQSAMSVTGEAEAGAGRTKAAERRAGRASPS